MSWPVLLIIALLLAALGVAALLIIRLRRERRELRRELIRTLQAGARNLDAQEQELAWLRAAIDLADVGVIVTDRAKTILAMNPAAAALFGHDSTGTGAIVVLRHHELERLLDAALDGEPIEPQLIRTTRREVRALAAPWPNTGSVQGAVLIARDVTEQQRLSRARRDFIANISHELRTPLTSLKLLIESLQAGGLDDPAYGPRLLTRLSNETEAMIRLVEDMTALATVESGRMPLRLAPVSLASLVAARVARLAHLAESRSIRVVQQVPPDLTALLDEERFGQVLTNLLDNALKFSPENGTVTIRATPHDGAIRLTVEDTGSGIAPADLPRIFERFYKSDAARDRSAESRGGTGLGLAIARHLVEAHGGKIWAESPPGRGALFVVELPAESAPRPQAEGEKATCADR